MSAWLVKTRVPRALGVIILICNVLGLLASNYPVTTSADLTAALNAVLSGEPRMLLKAFAPIVLKSPIRHVHVVHVRQLHNLSRSRVRQIFTNRMMTDTVQSFSVGYRANWDYDLSRTLLESVPTSNVYSKIIFQVNDATYRLPYALLVEGGLELDASSLRNGVTLLPAFATTPSVGTLQHFQVAERSGNLTAINVRFKDARLVVRWVVRAR